MFRLMTIKAFHRWRFLLKYECLEVITTVEWWASKWCYVVFANIKATGGISDRFDLGHAATV